MIASVVLGRKDELISYRERANERQRVRWDDALGVKGKGFVVEKDEIESVLIVEVDIC